MEYNPNPVVNVIPSPADKHQKEATTAMILGIIGLALSWWGILTIAGLILSILGFTRARKNREFAAGQGLEESGKNKAGYICGLIGMILSIIALFVIIVAIVVGVVFGLAFLKDALPTIIEEAREYAAALPALSCLL